MTGINLRPLKQAAYGLATLLVLAGCASTEVTESQNFVGDRQIPRPDHIFVFDFSATPGDVDANATIADQVGAHSTPQSAEEVALGRKLGVEIAKDLVEEIKKMGLPAVRAADGPAPQPGDAEIKGHLVSINQGSTAKRLLVGFGSGAAELKTVVEGYLVTQAGLEPLGTREVEAGTNKMPGVILPAAVLVATANPIGLVVGGGAKLVGEVSGTDTIEGDARRTAEEIAKSLKPRFEEMGWIAAGSTS